MRRLGLQFIFCLMLWQPAIAQPAIDSSQPVFMDADKLGYDQKNSIVVAMGNVRVFQGESVLYADRIYYYQNQRIVRAKGNVRVDDKAKGETYYAQEVQLKDDLKEGIIQNFRVRMSDDSQFAAREARRINETQTELSQAVYSPCEICEGEDPFWQIKADKVHIDEAEQEIAYDNLFLELYGVPVAYTPYFSHPTPNADAKTGLLAPEYSQSSNLGTTLALPYYIAIAPDKDATITPMFLSEESPVLIGQYRQLFDDGSFEFNGSITNTYERDDNGLQLSEREFRGHFFARGDTKINQHWRTGFDIQRTTDDTYLRRYRFGNFRSLTSVAFAQGLYGRSFVNIEGLTFQGLEANDDEDQEPFVLPLIEGYYESDPGVMGLDNLRRFHSANVQIIARDEGIQSRRLSLQNGLKLPVATSGGHLFDAQLSTRVDLYSAESLTFSDGRTNQDAESARMIPQAALKWRYPLINRFEGSSMTIEPTVMLVASPSGNNPDTIPNEDNQIVEFTNSNLFRLNPYPGLDQVDEGSRIAYGLRGQWLFDGSQNIQWLLGQNYSLDEDTPFPYNDEAGEHFSDYVGRVALDYRPFALSYRFRIDQDDLTSNTSAVTLNYSQRPLSFNANYITINNDLFLQDREELLVGTGVWLTDEWQLSANARRDLLLDTMTNAGFGAVYQNECFQLLANFSRQFTRDRDIEPDDRISVRLSFMNMSGF